MMNIHVVSFQVPYPADYGGAIDVFYKLQALRQSGHNVKLHTFIYGERKQQPLLEELCDKVYYYPRLLGWRLQFSLLPYIVSTRRSQVLLANLCRDDAPILFEGLHCCYHLDHPLLARRRKTVRMHNIEHEYYSQLARQSPLGWKWLYYRIESWRLKRFEQKLAHADLVCAITEADERSLRQLLPQSRIVLMPCFFDIQPAATPQPTCPFVLYQGNLAVEENSRAARFIMEKVAPRLPYVSFVIAGHAPRLGSVPENVTVVADPTEKDMNRLISTAHVHLLITFQPTGIKLKLINAIVKGPGYIVANSSMLYGHDLGQLCTVADSAQEMVSHIEQLIELPPAPDRLSQRREKLLSIHNEAVGKFKFLFCDDSRPSDS